MHVNSTISWWRSKLAEYLHCPDEIYHIMQFEILSSIFLFLREKNIWMIKHIIYIYGSVR